MLIMNWSQTATLISRICKPEDFSWSNLKGDCNSTDDVTVRNPHNPAGCVQCRCHLDSGGSRLSSHVGEVGCLHMSCNITNHYTPPPSNLKFPLSRLFFSNFPQYRYKFPNPTQRIHLYNITRLTLVQR